MNEKETTRNYTLDLFRCIAACFIVFIHAPFSGKFGEIIALFAQGGVLLFFMISGFYSYDADIKRIKHSIKHIFVLICLTYFINIFRIMFSTGGALQNTFYSMFTIKHLVQFLFLNVSAVSGVLWFLLALLYCYIIYGIFVVKASFENKMRLFYGISFSLLFMNVLLGDLLRYAGITCFMGYIRNFCMTGIPFFGLGHWLHNLKCKGTLGNYRNAHIILAVFIGGGITIAEGMLSIVQPTYTVGSIIVSVFVFIFAINNPGFYVSPLNWIGRNCCFMIYIFHPVVIHLLKWLIPENFNENHFAIAVLACTLLLAIIVAAVKDIMSKRIC